MVAEKEIHKPLLKMEGKETTFFRSGGREKMEGKSMLFFHMVI